MKDDGNLNSEESLVFANACIAICLSFGKYGIDIKLLQPLNALASINSNSEIPSHEITLILILDENAQSLIILVWLGIMIEVAEGSSNDEIDELSLDINNNCLSIFNDEFPLNVILISEFGGKLPLQLKSYFLEEEYYSNKNML